MTMSVLKLSIVVFYFYCMESNEHVGINCEHLMYYKKKISGWSNYLVTLRLHLHQQLCMQQQLLLARLCIGL